MGRKRKKYVKKSLSVDSSEADKVAPHSLVDAPMPSAQSPQQPPSKDVDGSHEIKSVRPDLPRVPEVSLLDLTVTYDYSTDHDSQCKRAADQDPESSMQQLTELFTFERNSSEGSSSLWKDMQARTPPKKRLKLFPSSTPFHRLTNIALELEAKIQNFAEKHSDHGKENTFCCHSNTTSSICGNDISDSEDFWSQVASQVDENNLSTVASDDEFIDQLLVCSEEPLLVEQPPKVELCEDELRSKEQRRKQQYSCLEIEKKRQSALLRLAEKKTQLLGHN